MQENENLQPDNISSQAQSDPAQDKANEKPKLKRNGLKEKFKKKGEELDEKEKPPMNMEETIKFYKEKLPFMRLQDEYDETVYRFNERRVKNLELQVRELEAIGYLGQWKAQQDEAKRKHDNEQKMKEEWDAMTPEQREEWKQKAKANLRIMEMQAKGSVLYDGTNAGDIMSFVTGELHSEIISQEEDKHFCFQIPDGAGGFTELCLVPGQTLTRTEAGEFIVSFE